MKKLREILENTHWNKLKSIQHTDQPAIGTSPRAWANSAGLNKKEHDVDPDKLPNKALDRDELHAYVNHPATSATHAAAAIMAWGGQNRTHGKSMFHPDERSKWEPYLSSLRTPNHGITPGKAYDRFNAMNVKGLGPSYFTKILHYTVPGAHIMDQWTAKSHNLIHGHEDIKFANDQGNAIHRTKNDGETYERFNKTCRKVGKKFFTDSGKGEERLFSYGGKGSKAGEWRKHVRNNWTPANKKESPKISSPTVNKTNFSSPKTTGYRVKVMELAAMGKSNDEIKNSFPPGTDHKYLYSYASSGRKHFQIKPKRKGLGSY
jgi:hypothetical protein